MVCTTPPGACYSSPGYCSGGSCKYNPKASGSACSGSNVCQSYSCNGSGSCTGNAKGDGTQYGQGIWNVCCNGNPTALDTGSNCGGCGIGCASGKACVDVGTACHGTKAYCCDCSANSQCSGGEGTCVTTYWQSCWYWHCAAGYPAGGCSSSFCGPNESVQQSCSGSGCTFSQQPCYCAY